MGSSLFRRIHHFLLYEASYSPSILTSYLLKSYSNRRSLSTESNHPEFAGGGNAYEILGVSETSSFAEIKASFRKLAKQTHPDLVQESSTSSTASRRFVQILAAYEILSDVDKRAHYDRYLLSQKKLIQKQSFHGPSLHTYRSYTTAYKQVEVVEWLKWYRSSISDILSEKRVASGTGYFDELEGNFYSAVHAAFYGPEIESMELLPDRFEAEERSVCETPEILHLVSGRYLFGMVCLMDEKLELSFTSHRKLTPTSSMVLDQCKPLDNANINLDADGTVSDNISRMQRKDGSEPISDAYRDLELHVSGRLVASASRMPPKNGSNLEEDADNQDHIHVYLNLDEHVTHDGADSSSKHGSARSRILLGTIAGLGTSPEEGSCSVYDNGGKKSHMIMKHRTFLVKHMHWFQVGEEISICECRCSRARLPPSKFWLFEPRCSMHDIGGWYIETFGRDKKSITVPSRRYWDGFDSSGLYDKRLHPAMYLFALAYRTLDIEAAQRRKRSVRDIAEGFVLKILNWYKKQS